MDENKQAKLEKALWESVAASEKVRTAIETEPPERVKRIAQRLILIIESYQMDIRDSGWVIESAREQAEAESLFDLGWCQGSIYRKIDWILNA